MSRRSIAKRPEEFSSRLRAGWRDAVVADICEMNNGRGFGPEDWDTEGLPIIRIQNLNGGVNFDYYAGAVSERWLVRSGQLLFAWAGTRGVSFGPTVWRGPMGVLNQHIFKVEPRPKIEGEWLEFALRHVTDRIERRAHGFKATLVHVKKSDIERQSVYVPPQVEQRKIAAALRSWCNAIAVSERLTLNSRSLRSGIADRLLWGKQRLLNDCSWIVRPLSDLLVESRVPGSGGRSAKKLTVKLYGHGVIAKSEKHRGSDSTKYYRRSSGQFIYSKLDFLNGAFGIVPKNLNGYESTLDLPAFDFTGAIEPRWFLHLVSSERFYRSHLGLANGGRKARRVNPSDLLRVRVSIPEPKEQRAIANAIDMAGAVVGGYEEHTRVLRLQYRRLLDELLTGRSSLNSDRNIPQP